MYMYIYIHTDVWLYVQYLYSGLVLIDSWCCWLVTCHRNFQSEWDPQSQYGFITIDCHSLGRIPLGKLSPQPVEAVQGQPNDWILWFIFDELNTSHMQWMWWQTQTTNTTFIAFVCMLTSPRELYMEPEPLDAKAHTHTPKGVELDQKINLLQFLQKAHWFSPVLQVAYLKSYSSCQPQKIALAGHQQCRKCPLQCHVQVLNKAGLGASRDLPYLPAD